MVRRLIDFNSKGQTQLRVADHHDRKLNVEHVFRNYNRVVPSHWHQTTSITLSYANMSRRNQMKRWYLYKPVGMEVVTLAHTVLNVHYRKEREKGEIINSMCARG